MTRPENGLQDHWRTLYSLGQLFMDLASRVFANGPGDRDSIPSRVIPKILKTALKTSLLNTQHYMARIKSKVEQSRERNSTVPYTLM